LIPLPSTHALLRFPGLESITVIDTLNNFDVFLGEVDQNPGEFQAWEICERGLADKWSYSSPTQLSAMGHELLEAWEELEICAWGFIRPTKSLLTRFVSLDRLSQMKEWESRRLWNEENICVSDWCCIYPRDTCHHLLEFLELLECHYEGRYRALDRTLRRYLPSCCERNIDLIRIVATLFSDQCLCQVPCNNEHQSFRPCPGCRGRIMDIMRLLADLVRYANGIIPAIGYWNQLPADSNLKRRLLRWLNDWDFYPHILSSMKLSGTWSLD